MLGKWKRRVVHQVVVNKITQLQHVTSTLDVLLILDQNPPKATKPRLEIHPSVLYEAKRCERCGR